MQTGRVKTKLVDQAIKLADCCRKTCFTQFFIHASFIWGGRVCRSLLQAWSSYQKLHTQILRDLIKSAHISYRIIHKSLKVRCSSCHDLGVNDFWFLEFSLKGQLCLTGVNKPWTEKWNKHLSKVFFASFYTMYNVQRGRIQIMNCLQSTPHKRLLYPEKSINNSRYW